MSNFVGVATPGVTPHGHQSRDSRPRTSSVSRDIFPLPIPSKMEGGHDLGRRSAQRFARKFHARERLRDAILGLNWLAGFGLEENPRIQEPDSLQHDVLCRASFLSNLCNDKGDLSQVPKPEAALKVLLQGRSEYGSEAPTTLAACALERISLPGCTLCSRFTGCGNPSILAVPRADAETRGRALP